ncbi:MAG TPA: hypothetical protein VFM97_00210 [Gammaproteobacteria bacterium]|nr:hypothetical protein [Gammaproteobacteria bacterium]
MASRVLPPIIGLAGHAGTGKDTAAKFLAVLGYRPFSFSDALYTEVADAFGVPRHLLTTRETKETDTSLLALEHCGDAGFIAALLDADVINTMVDGYTVSRSPRWIMQRWGTEYRRRQDPDYWIKRAADIYRRRGPLMANTSTRFENEAAWIRAGGGVIFRLQRDAAGCAAHSSERDLPAALVDAEVDNNGSLDDLFKHLQAALATLA